MANLYSGSTQRFEGAIMTIAEAATYLFVSRPHIRKLLASGKILEIFPKDPNGQVNIDVVSVEAYRREQAAAIQVYQDAQAEDDEKQEH
ncbi:helix-turn-helix domain-containing protein [Paraburkholderia tropica]|uniref:helix-turn-helix domain-containing protein n=1 Tax=Paraburkholderia tropica TaxID=92647 RepID=UPI001FC80710|nr:helix-turn-helix domain-containing protein [Paraburkholderia tropica]